jgi:hypothetical protein
MSEIDETSARKEITEAVLMAGVMAFSDYKERRKADAALSKFDMVTDIYVAMRRAAAEAAGGMVLVPRIPTKEMLEAAWADALAEDAKGVWKAMIDAALK